jgi:hypothetical protein
MLIANPILGVILIWIKKKSTIKVYALNKNQELSFNSKS